MEKLFERFYTVESARNSTGIGLSIARLLTERMGGDITAEYKDAQKKYVMHCMTRISQQECRGILEL